MTIAKGSLVGLAVMLLCFFLPVVNFVAGPVAPLIAGFVVGNKVQPSRRDGAAISLVLGILMFAGITGLLMLNSGRVTPDPPYTLVTGYVVAVLGISGGMAWLGVHLGRRTVLHDPHEAAAQIGHAKEGRGTRVVRALDRHRNLSGAVIFGILLSASAGIFLFFSLWDGRMWWFPALWLAVLVTMLLIGMVGTTIAFFWPAMRLLRLVRSAVLRLVRAGLFVAAAGAGFLIHGLAPPHHEGRDR